MSEAMTYMSICQQYKDEIEFTDINFNDKIFKKFYKHNISPH